MIKLLITPVTALSKGAVTSQ